MNKPQTTQEENNTTLKITKPNKAGYCQHTSPNQLYTASRRAKCCVVVWGQVISCASSFFPFSVYSIKPSCVKQSSWSSTSFSSTILPSTMRNMKTIYIIILLPAAGSSTPKGFTTLQPKTEQKHETKLNLKQHTEDNFLSRLANMLHEKRRRLECNTPILLCHAVFACLRLCWFAEVAYAHYCSYG